jgi:hypothetical protein
MALFMGVKAIRYVIGPTKGYFVEMLPVNLLA